MSLKQALARGAKKQKTGAADRNLLAKNSVLGGMFAKADLPTVGLLPQWENVVQLAAEVKESLKASVELFGRLTDVLKAACPTKHQTLVAVTMHAQANAINAMVEEFEACSNRILKERGAVLSEEMVDYFEAGDNFTVLASRIGGELIPNNHTLSVVVQQMHANLIAAGEEEGAALLADVLDAEKNFKVSVAVPEGDQTQRGMTEFSTPIDEAAFAEVKPAKEGAPIAGTEEVGEALLNHQVNQ